MLEAHPYFHPNSERIIVVQKVKDAEILKFLEERLAAHEGGAGSVSIGYDDATFNYVITQKNLSTKNNEVLGCSRSLSRAFKLAISGEKYD